MQFPLGSSEGTYSCQIHSLRGSCGTPGKQHCQSNLDLFKSLELALKTAIYMLSITCCLSQVLVSKSTQLKTLSREQWTVPEGTVKKGAYGFLSRALGKTLTSGLRLLRCLNKDLCWDSVFFLTSSCWYKIEQPIKWEIAIFILGESIWRLSEAD